MPSHSVKQAKVMSAIAHGWKPKGSVAKIPVKVAKDFHAADAGHKYGAKHKASMARHIARKTAKKADGGKTRFSDFRKSNDVEDRRKESHHRPLVKNVPPDASEPGPIPQPSFISDQLGGLALDKEMDEKGVDFADGGATDDDQKQQAISIHPVVDEPSEADKAAMMPETYANPLVKNMISGVATLPQRAIEASQEDVQHLGEENYEPQSTGPAVETALATMGIPGLAAPTVPGAVGAGFGTMLKSANKTAVTPSVLEYASKYGMTGIEHPDIKVAEAATAKALKQPYPKDIATQAVEAGYTREQIENIKSYMSPGAQKAFDKHYSKIVPDAKPWQAPEVQATKPNLAVVPKTDPNYIANYHTNQGTDISKVLKDLEDELTGAEHAPDDWYQEHNGTIVEPKPQGKDTDIEDYYAEMEKHQAGPEWEPEDNPNQSPYDKFVSQKITYPEYKQQIRQHFIPSNWLDFRAKDVGKVERPPLDWGKNDPLKLEKELGVNIHAPIYKGGFYDSNTFKPGGYPEKLMDPATMKHGEPAFFAATNPGIAEAYHGSPNIGGAYVARAPKFFEFDWNKFHGDPSYSAGDMNAIIKQAKEMGADVIALHNMSDVGSAQHGLHTQLAFLNTSVLRAPHANFDPSKLHLRHPLAGLAGGGLFTYGVLSGKPDEDHMNRGGTVSKKDKDPEEHEFIDFKQGGLIDSHIPGRTDKIPMKVQPGSYVLPADIPSALGQGNTKAGSEILKKMFTHSAYGLEPMKAKGHEFKYPHSIFKHKDGGKVKAEKALPEDHQLGMKVPKGGSMCANCKFLASPTTCGNEGFVKWNGGPKLPFPADEYCCDNYGHTKAKGKADGGENDHASIIAAGGEYIIHPDDVKEVGHGDMAAGHKTLDRFVLHTRKEHIRTLRKLKPPKK